VKRVHLPHPRTGELKVEGDAFHHLARVLRVKAGEALQVFDGVGKVFDAKVLSVGEATLTLELGAAHEAAGALPVWLLQGLPKGDKFELVVQKSTELGVAAVVPVVMERSISRPKDGVAKAERWLKIATEAARQCGRADVPEIPAPRSLDDALKGLPPDARLLVLDEEERAVRLSSALDDSGTPVLVVGPEGGLTRDEVGQLKAKGAKTVTLGPRILRTETAALAALSVILHRRGELG
jgi:16S rRNA (uracil1498-N3)-methyltransferase